MKAKHHFWSSAALGGALSFVTGSPMAVIGAMVGGFLIDGDHVFDQLWSVASGAPHLRRAAASDLAKGGVRGWLARYVRRRKLVRLPLIFHSYEVLIALALIALMYNTPFTAGVISGYALHLALDIWRHHHELRSPFFYFLTYRLRHGFRRDSLVKAEYL